MSKQTKLQIARHVREEPRSWLTSTYPEFTEAYRNDARENMTIEQEGCMDLACCSLLFKAYYQRDEYGTTERVMRHYYAYRNQERTDWPQYGPWQAIEYWTESYNLAEIEEQEYEDEINFG